MTNKELVEGNKLQALIAELEEQKELFDSRDVNTSIVLRSDRNDCIITELGVGSTLRPIIRKYLADRVTEATKEFEKL